MAANANPTEAGPPSQPLSRQGVLPWLMPSLTQWLWLMILLILLAQPWRTMMVASDGDPCLHWRVGEYMLETRHIIRADVFSHTRYGQPIVTKEWLSELIFALAGRRAGLYGLVVVATLLIATTFAMLHRQLLRETGNHVVAIFVVLLAVWAAWTHWLARPHAFSFLLAALWCDALRRFERDASGRRLGVVLGVLTVLWVNLHSGYLAGFITLGVYWLGTAIELIRGRSDRNRWLAAQQKLRVLTGVVVLCALVSLLNPNGYRLHLLNFQFLRSDYLANWLAEYASSNFHEIDSRGFLVWLAFTFLTLALVRPRLSPTNGLMLIVWTYLALYTRRNIPLLAIFVSPILATALADASPAWVRRLSDRLGETDEVARGGLLVGMAAVVAIALWPRPTEMPAMKWPLDAVKYIQQHPDQFQGNMFNQYIWGGYLLHALPEHRVFVDGRTDFYGESLIRQYDDTSALRTNWMQALDEYHVSWTLLPTEHRLNLALALLPNWQCVYTNEVATIFRKQP